MELLSVFKGLRKSNSDSKLGLRDRLSFARKSKLRNTPDSPLPPRPNKRSVGTKTNGIKCENIQENIISGPMSDISKYAHGKGNQIFCQTAVVIQYLFMGIGRPFIRY